MRGFVSTIVVGVTLSGAFWVPPTFHAHAAAPAGDSTTDPAELYDQGRKAYRLGDFETAVQKWELAYELSDRPLLLYNISLAYKGLFGITKDIADLRRARAVLDNFIKLAEADPDVEIDDALERLAELDTMIAEAEQSQGATDATADRQDDGVVPPPKEPEPSKPAGKDPGKVFRLSGIGLMGGGGGLLLTAAGLGIYYALKSQEFSRGLQSTLEDFNEAGCVENDPMPESPCSDYQRNIDIYRENGKKANQAGYISVAITGGLGLAAMVTGAVLYTEGNRRSRRWEQGISKHELRFHWSGRHFGLSGRF